MSHPHSQIVTSLLLAGFLAVKPRSLIFLEERGEPRLMQALRDPFSAILAIKLKVANSFCK